MIKAIGKVSGVDEVKVVEDGVGATGEVDGVAGVNTVITTEVCYFSVASSFHGFVMHSITSYCNADC